VQASHAAAGTSWALGSAGRGSIDMLSEMPLLKQQLLLSIRLQFTCTLRHMRQCCFALLLLLPVPHVLAGEPEDRPQKLWGVLQAVRPLGAECGRHHMLWGRM
jgi:hypothetical protein